MKPNASCARSALLLSLTLSSMACSVPQRQASPLPESTENATTPEPVAARCDIVPALDWMQGQHIPYTQSPSDEWRDCSGNFLRLSSRIASLCPDVQLAAPPGVTAYSPNGNNKRPGPEAARTTRGLARWYDEQGAFVPIYYDGTDPLDAPRSLQRLRNRIDTGTVLWFSPQVPLAASGKEALYRDPGGAINHMGTVVSVARDNAGNVTGWRMYHGQNARQHNGVTEHFWARSGRSRPVPQGGYGSQRIVGFAESILPTKVARN